MRVAWRVGFIVVDEVVFYNFFELVVDSKFVKSMDAMVMGA